MTSDFKTHRLDEAMDAIEATILPNLAMMLEAMLEAAEAGRTTVAPCAYFAELRGLASQLELLAQAARDMPSAEPAEDAAPRSAAA